MSNHLISEVYRRQVGNIARKAVMVLLADKASDDGSGIWASKQRMADELGASRQTVISTIKTLIADGLIREVGERRCLNGFTVEYAIDVDVLRALPVVKSHEDNPSKDLTRQAPLRVKELDATRQAPLRDPSKDLTQTLLNPPEPKKSKPALRAAVLSRPDEVTEQIWNDFLKLRKAKRAPVSPTVIASIGREAGEIGWTLEQALAECVARGWQGFKAKWVQNADSRFTNGATGGGGFLDHLMESGSVGSG